MHCLRSLKLDYDDEDDDHSVPMTLLKLQFSLLYILESPERDIYFQSMDFKLTFKLIFSINGTSLYLPI